MTLLEPPNTPGGKEGGEGRAEPPKISLLQSSKERLRRRLEDKLQSMGRLLEEQLPQMMTELLAAARDKMLSPAESQLTRSLLMEVIELHAHRWSPLEALTTQYYDRTIQKLTTTA
ncbi:CBP80/20-dependent translation initiation factor [Liparis tanakae]|uniref:CBP80/20-dependent translation initiation factor n=1 Tax=Liparis tanakae TaxID=230148 RepID=A0A4Z2IW85_9TELE|nr:CBP80/20-dependent translation initiation factor [Liparis tanakae]